MQKAIFVTEITVVDPDTNGNVSISIFKHENGGMFGIDSSFYEQDLCDEDDEDSPVYCNDPLNANGLVELVEI
jgi:hypothetical protein